MKRRDALITLLVGVAMGLVDAVPGVSGGTIAFIAGKYERLVKAIAAIDAELAKDVLRGDVGSLRNENTVFLLVLFSGLALGGLTMARFIEVALTAAPSAVNGFFFGIIAGSGIVIGQELEPNKEVIVTVLVGAAVAILVGGLSLSGLPASNGLIFIAGILAVSALLLPGVSGSFVLYLLGQYEFVVAETIASLPEHIIALVNGQGSIDPFVTLGVFGLGGLIGGATIARIATRLLQRYRLATLGALTGLMLGSLRIPLRRIIGGSGSLGLAVLAAILGLAAALLLTRFGS